MQEVNKKILKNFFAAPVHHKKHNHPTFWKFLSSFFRAPKVILVETANRRGECNLSLKISWKALDDSPI